MIIVDTALKKREAEGRPVRVGMVGAGFMGRGIANQILDSVPGMELVAIANRHDRQRAARLREAGVAEPRDVNRRQVQDAIRGEISRHVTIRTLICSRCRGHRRILEVTGAVEFGARIVAARHQAQEAHDR